MYKFHLLELQILLLNYLLADQDDELAVEKYPADSAPDTQLGSPGSRQGETDRTARGEDLDSSPASSLQRQCSGQTGGLIRVMAMYIFNGNV